MTATFDGLNRVMLRCDLPECDSEIVPIFDDGKRAHLKRYIGEARLRASMRGWCSYIAAVGLVWDFCCHDHRKAYVGRQGRHRELPRMK